MKIMPESGFLLEMFFRGWGEFIVMQISFYAIIVLGPNFRERQMLFFWGGQTASGVAPCGRKPGLSTNEPPVVLQRRA